MSLEITVGAWTFDHVSYDADADVAYLSIGPPRRAFGDETPEGHIALFDEATGEFCGLTLIGLRAMTEGDGPSTVTLPRPPEEVPVGSSDLRRLACA